MGYKYSNATKQPKKVSNLGQKGYPRSSSHESVLQGLNNTKFMHDKNGRSVPASAAVKVGTKVDRALAKTPVGRVGNKLVDKASQATKAKVQKEAATARVQKSNARKMAVKSAIANAPTRSRRSK